METIYLSCIEIYASSHCIDNGFGLLKNLFLHECGISSFHYLLDFHLKGCNLASHWVTILMVIYELCTKFSPSFLPSRPSHIIFEILPIIQSPFDTMNRENPIWNRSYIIIFQKDNPIRMLNDCTGIAGKKVLHL